MTCLQGVYDSDFLDDSALIKAFDNAINPIKVFIAHFLSFFCISYTKMLLWNMT